ncbi:DUF397 domain-containing protein [Actinomadura sp. GC306]|uniref:DUF397 domain-containing protein n=1 Tax=Actinomadura sp. GC306 TaxID=2530367 RepID=UPI0010506802|nr:DUF397 domain-containing protein [Actinomadura sp. GC306]TDC69603.1 DUF397 domain-containing protein [Actinomadura sp. GC306]
MTPSADPSSAVWRKASKSTATGNECVELAAMTDVIAVRDSKRLAGRDVTMTRPAFTRLVNEIRRGQYDL